jgi:tyrosyl-tRNA synthetase
MRIKFGIDPTGKTIHLGRTVPLLKLKKFQKEGHQIVLIIGDFTAQIGDPSDKLSKRPELTDKQVLENERNYLTLIGKILDIDKCEIHHNSEWFDVMTARELMELQDLFTLQQMSARRNFSERIKNAEPISLKELNYPLLQGYDSYKVKADIEVGGEDQLFNLLAGRDVQKHFEQKPQEIITTPMLVGTDGRKMSTSWGNVINIDDQEKEMFDKILCLRDELTLSYLENCTEDFDFKDYMIREIKEGRADYRKFKELLANEIIRMYK